jgi:glycosyltransferase involved in cell wall biosynthesis
VIFAGWVSEAEKVAHYNLADVYVMPSYGEGFGIVFLEAAACGLEVIGSKVDGSREALLDGILGQLVDPKKPEELTSAIVAALTKTARRSRNDAIGTFDVSHFRARVRDWVDRQALARNSSAASKE